MVSGLTLPGIESSPLISDWFQVEPDDRLSLRSGRAELGQGIYSSFTQIASMELDLPVEKIKVLPPDTSQSPNEGFTAGSLSISQGGQTVRLAASALRNLCLKEASARLGCSESELEINQGEISMGDGRSASLIELAASINLDRQILQLAKPKPGSERNSEAHQVPRIDLRDRMVGQPFIHDIAFENMLFGKVIHPPTPRAKLKYPQKISELGKLDGIEKVVVEGNFIGFIADSNASAESAFDWTQSEFSWEYDEMEESDPFKLMEMSNAPMEYTESSQHGMPNPSPDISLSSRRGFISHGSIGPSTAVAVWNDGNLTVWSSTQGVFPLRKALSMVFSLDESRIRVKHANGAGCYGHNGADDVSLDAALLARQMPERPIRVMWSRQDEFMTSPVGAASEVKVNVWLGDSGKMDAMSVHVTSPPHSMRPSSFNAPCLYSAQLLPDPFELPEARDVPIERGGGATRNAVPIYDIGNVEVGCKLVTGLPWRTSSLRSLGAHLNVYAIETAVEAAAGKSSLDSFEFRLANLEDERARNVLSQLNENCLELRHTSENRDWGLGFARYKGTGAWAAVFAGIEMEDRLRVTDVQVVVDMGEVISRDGAVNQIEGGVLQAISWTLNEQVKLDGAAIGTRSWDDYPILRFSDLPKVEVQLVDKPDHPPLGCAEVVQGPTAAAIGNAVQRLTGCHVQSLPLTRESIISDLSK